MAYVYRHIRLDKNEPFYIGIGKTRYRHSCKQNRNPIWRHIVAKTDFEVEILFDDVSWKFACIKEIEFIALYGRIDLGTGVLANMTNGGDGNLGLVHSDDALKKISESSRMRKGYWKGREFTEEMKKKISLSKIGNTYTKGKKLNLSDEHRKAVRERMRKAPTRFKKGHSISDEVRKKIGDANRGRKRHPDVIAAISSKRKIPVNKIDIISGIIVGEYDSIKEAAQDMMADPSSLAKACKGKNKSCVGYRWEYKKTAEAVFESSL